MNQVTPFKKPGNQETTAANDGVNPTPRELACEAYDAECEIDEMDRVYSDALDDMAERAGELAQQLSAARFRMNRLERENAKLMATNAKLAYDLVAKHIDRTMDDADHAAIRQKCDERGAAIAHLQRENERLRQALALAAMRAEGQAIENDALRASQGAA